MKKQLRIGNSSLTNTIYCGHLIQNGTVWGANKTDVTVEAIAAVIEHAMEFEKRSNAKLALKAGGKKYVVNIEIIDEDQPHK